MKNMHKRLAIAAAVLTFGGAAQAAPVFAPGGNDVFFNNFENLYRATGSCTVATCLAPTAGDPAGFQRVNPFTSGNIQVGDIFAGTVVPKWSST